MTLLLAACVSSTRPPSAPDSRQRDPAHPVDNWRIQGRISLRDANQSALATLDWTQNHAQGVLRLSGPWGLGTRILHYGPDHAELTSSDGETYSAANLEALMQQHLGWSTPPFFHYWVRGLPEPDTHAVQTLDAQDRLAELEQAGWHIMYMAYTHTNGIALPKKIRMHHEAPVTITLAIHSWELDP